jgi:hypothetical protein
MSKWIDFVKAFADKHKLSYRDALRSFKCKEEYSKSKSNIIGKGIEGRPYYVEGGELSSSDLKGLLDASYDGRETVGDFQIDKALSTDNSKVYYNPKLNQAIVAHKGTTGITDWGNNAVYALFGKTGYKQTQRYKDAEKVQKKAEAKYGAKNISTIGHSQGGLQAELLGKKTNETITLDKATRPFANKKSENQFDIRSKNDVVSALNPFQKENKKEIVLDSKTFNPLTSHDIGQLDTLAPDKMIGQGICAKCMKKMKALTKKNGGMINSDEDSMNALASSNSASSISSSDSNSSTIPLVGEDLDTKTMNDYLIRTTPKEIKDYQRFLKEKRRKEDRELRELIIRKEQAARRKKEKERIEKMNAEIKKVPPP